MDIKSILGIKSPSKEVFIPTTNKAKGYLSFNDSKSVLQVFGMEDPDLGYEVVMEIDYGSDRNYVDRILFTLTKLIEFENMKEIIQSDKYIIKFK